MKKKTNYSKEYQQLIREYFIFTLGIVIGFILGILVILTYMG